jgi:hypothetical protein
VKPPKKGQKGAKATLEFRWEGVIDLDEARKEVADILEVWREVSRWPDAPPFTGGVFDEWPRRLSQGISFLKSESQAVLSYLMHLEG